MFSLLKKSAERIGMSSLLKLLLEGNVVKIGVSSDYDHRKKLELFDKRYYIEDTEYLSPAEFSHAFARLSQQTAQTVLRIDGVAPKYDHSER